jgi:hypothetical protein
MSSATTSRIFGRDFESGAGSGEAESSADSDEGAETSEGPQPLSKNAAVRKSASAAGLPVSIIECPHQ